MIGISTALIGWPHHGITTPDTSRPDRRAGRSSSSTACNKGLLRGRLAPNRHRPDHRRSRQCGHPGPNLKFDDDATYNSLTETEHCATSSPRDIARRPIANSVMFGATFSAEDFKIAPISREEAAIRCDHRVSNESASARLRRRATVTNSDSCNQIRHTLTSPAIASLQKVLDLPAGQLPEPPICHDLDATLIAPQQPILPGTVAAHRQSDHDGQPPR